MRILQVIGTLEPRYGGPVEVLKQLSLSAVNLGHNVEVVTLDKTSEYFINKKGIIVHALGPSIGKYRFNIKLIPWLIKNANRFDVVICNGIWQFQSLAIWLASRFKKFRYFVFVHGALDPWFKYAYPIKHIKKSLYWPWAEYNVLRTASGVLYTTEDEKALARKSFSLYKANEIVINIGIIAPVGDANNQKELFYKEYPSLRHKNILLFLSRIHPKKGCDILLEAFSASNKKDPLLHLVIVGPDETNWVPLLKKRAQKLGIEEKITWTGMLNGDTKWGAINAASCFILPSHSENFGVVVAESLACGVPVIITDKVNIWREIENQGAGFVSTDTVAGVEESIMSWIELSDLEKEQMKSKAKECFWEHFEINLTTKKFLEIIETEL